MRLWFSCLDLMCMRKMKRVELDGRGELARRGRVTVLLTNTEICCSVLARTLILIFREATAQPPALTPYPALVPCLCAVFGPGTLPLRALSHHGNIAHKSTLQLTLHPLYLHLDLLSISLSSKISKVSGMGWHRRYLSRSIRLRPNGLASLLLIVTNVYYALPYYGCRDSILSVLLIWMDKICFGRCRRNRLY
ncbi:uncharacterized protein LY79DRAFT_241091 [Colletotrichum navitas]|uniref:Uncharacterized protein n=1 Tax=Colletotrichum navitas TaxID=681940 RepID=A0AAD8V4P4_9PEZI|nr:uncharacterized protein LY79DRAFT_241091 [Colletotrichum navitas]KAK1586150.1 hypothetical protein LY79DRAFT_241091 [Colletotrichum navitas]